MLFVALALAVASGLFGQPPSAPAPGERFIDPATSLVWVSIPAGSLTWATGQEREHLAWQDGTDRFRSAIVKPSWVLLQEVSAREWQRCIDGGTCDRLDAPPASDDAIEADWPSAAAYCHWAGGRLPTEVEWRVAAQPGRRLVAHPRGPLQETPGAPFVAFDERIAWDAGFRLLSKRLPGLEEWTVDGLAELPRRQWRVADEFEPIGPPASRERAAVRLAYREGRATRERSGFRCLRRAGQPRAGAASWNPIDGALYRHLPAGELTVGCALADDACTPQEPVRDATIERAFWIQATETTVTSYRSFLVAAGRRDENARAGFDDRPVVDLSWTQASEYCQWVGGRLPSDEEWEYAARSMGGRYRYPWGDHEPNGRAHFAADRPASVARKAPSRLGIYDLVGNAAEWTADEVPASEDPVRAIEALTEHMPAQLRSVRGGSWVSSADNLRISRRVGLDPEAHFRHVGFRCVVETLH